jgi:hypothetical protein
LYASILSAYSPNGEWRIRRKKFILSTMSDKVKGTVFREYRMGDHKPTYDEQITHVLGLSLTVKALSAYINQNKKN